MSTTSLLKPGTVVLVPWGVGEPRQAVVVEVWGDPDAPTHIRVLLTSESDDDSSLLLLNPSWVTVAA